MTPWASAEETYLSLPVWIHPTPVPIWVRSLTLTPFFFRVDSNLLANLKAEMFIPPIFPICFSRAFVLSDPVPTLSYDITT